jgi:3-hydroxybutyryl-CoA dehydrogenase
MKLGEAPEWPRRVAVVGAGRMGGGIAEAFAVAGLEVRVTDATPQLAQQAREQVVARARGHIRAGLLGKEALERAQSVEAADTPAEAVYGADLVLEAVAEDTGVKLDVHAAIEAAAPAEAVIATNTSSLDVNRLKGAIERRERFLGMHWFNPPEWTPGVEVVPVEETDPAVVERVVAFLSAIGKRPAVVSPAVGFIANRLQTALFCEAARCVEEGLADPAAIDEIVRSSFGFRLPFFGPFQIADMAGLDVYRAVTEQHRDAYGARFHVPEALERLVAEGDTGTASGAGFYAYDDPDALQSERDRRYAALAELLGELPPLEFSRRRRPGP